MKNKVFKSIMMLAVLTLGGAAAQAQTNSAENLDLYAVAELFRDSGSTEDFERALNDPTSGVNNLDLDDDGAVDFIRVTEQSKDDTRLVVLQAALGGGEFQDVGVIAVERENGGYNLQIQGDLELYGANYYVVPTDKNFGLWSVVRWLFSPGYRVYVSPYRYRVLPNWFAARRPFAVNVYRTRVNSFADRRNFIASRATTVRTINKISYRPARSNAVVAKKRVTTTVTNPRSGVQRTKQTTTVTKTKRGRRNR